MKAISLKQPWAELVVIGAKQWETREWQTYHRGSILIHASLTRKDAVELYLQNHFSTFVKNYHLLSYGAIIGECRIDRCAQTENIRNQLTDRERAFGDYSTGRWAWRLTNPIKYKNPIPYKGQLSVWEFPDEILAMHKIMQQ